MWCDQVGHPEREAPSNKAELSLPVKPANSAGHCQSILSLAPYHAHASRHTVFSTVLTMSLVPLLASSCAACVSIRDGTLDFFEAGALMLVMQLAVCDSCDQPIVDTHIWACSTCFGELAAATLGCPGQQQQQLQHQGGSGSNGQGGGGDGKVMLLCRGCRFRGAERDGVAGGSMGRTATDCVCSEGHPMRPAQVEIGVPIRETTWWKNIVNKQQQRMQGLASSTSSLQRSPGLETAGSRAAAAAGWRSDSLSSTAGAAPEPAGAAAAVTCLCCNAQHDVVPPYISHGHDRHVLALPDGSGHVCELCSTWICERCGKMEYADGRSGSPGMWLMSGCTHSQKCRKAGGGGWSIQRGPVVARAEDATRAHCATCRPGLLALRQVEQRRGGPLQERKGQQQQQVGGQPGVGDKGKPATKGKGFGAAVERQATGVTNKLADAGCVVM